MCDINLSSYLLISKQFWVWYSVCYGELLGCSGAAVLDPPKSYVTVG